MSRVYEGLSRAEARLRPLLQGLLDLEQNIYEAVNVSIALDLIMEAGDHAGELSGEEVRAALHISSQVVSIAKLLHADVTALLDGRIASGTEGEAA
jgi:hypothetical protein